VEREVPMKYVLSNVMSDSTNIIENYTSKRMAIDFKAILNAPYLYEKYTNKYVSMLKKYNASSTKLDKVIYEELDYIFSDSDEIVYCQIPFFPTVNHLKYMSKNSYDILKFMWFEFGLTKCWGITISK
jgi:hypothetical protein